MQTVILATETFSIPRSKWNGLPVALLPVAGRPVIEHILRFLCSDDSMGNIHVCTGSGGTTSSKKISSTGVPAGNLSPVRRGK